ncbi:pirin family protein [Bradyrhizobium sp. ISRA443]|uniref:pirin family protein n=1 Tax=unclassified Bradyrhizobium TaxID=2631580 RepID=UPI00247AEF3C|nr:MULTISPECIES: pirin family protein [unclassified Bradyrhizobium]WGR92123.1 pirin family protein [Bradyrhizobium sp. ISRA435]WGR96376.1 pirin family protein [Bradyrhizobium sp. ISRA436]WGS03261.1 pirin family protein [Bradyrhizobium sp. ISRA437]WGS10145.1 pirin family protein [Bradyrhizobium sp. ISRA443]
MSKAILGRYGNNRGHWVGDGFPVRSLFSYNTLGQHISPFLLLDYAGPHHFAPTTERRGVGQHPHRGFETVTIVYDGEVEHRDSAGNGGVIGPGDVQWMTAGGGILHEEYHSPAFAKTGGPFRMVQLWVNLPAKDKSAPGGYQAIVSADIPVVNLPSDAGTARIIAGELLGRRGPARTFTPINVWDVRLNRDADLTLDLPEGHTAMIVGLGGNVTVEGQHALGEAEMLLLGREGDSVALHADGDATLLILTGEPINEPIVGYGPFVMNSEAEIRQAIDDLNSGGLAKTG